MTNDRHTNLSQPDRAVPAGYATVTPWIISRDSAALIDFTRRAFGAQELARVARPTGGIDHAEVRIGDSVVMLFDTLEGWPETPAFLRLYVSDGDVVFQRALEAGASAVTEMTNLYFGDRVGRVRDPQGNIWWIQTHLEDVDPAGMALRLQDPAAVEALKYVQESLGAALARGPAV